MKKVKILMVFTILFVVQSCAVHHPLNSHRDSRHNGHISIHSGVSIHGGNYSHHGNLLGALIVGGIIGHMLTEAAHDEAKEIHEPQPPETNKNAQTK